MRQRETNGLGKVLVLILSLLFSFNNCSWAEEKGLAGCWYFDEGEGNIAKDTSGSHNDGEIHGAKWKENKSGYCLKFDGTDDYVDCGNDSSLDLTESFTIEAWVKLDQVETYQTVMRRGSSYRLMIKNTGEANLWIYKDWWRSAQTSTTLSINTWYHIAGVNTKVGNSNMIQMYLNGKSNGNLHSFNGDIVTSSGLLMGMGNTTSLEPFNGAIDDVRIYNRALSKEEILMHYQKGNKTEIAKIETTALTEIKDLSITCEFDSEE